MSKLIKSYSWAIIPFVPVIIILIVAFFLGISHAVNVNANALFTRFSFFALNLLNLNIN